ncbi:MAG: hypothetical protein R2851_20705 [Caldilineaceae bacterium]
MARRSRVVLDAFFAGAVDLATNDLETGVMGADIVILATPVRTIMGMLDVIGLRLWPGAVVMDMGTQARDLRGHGHAAARGPAHRRPSHDGQGDRRLRGSRAGSLPGCDLGAQPAGAPPTRRWRCRWNWWKRWAQLGHLGCDMTGWWRASATCPTWSRSALVDAVTAVGQDDPTVWELAAGGFHTSSRRRQRHADAWTSSHQTVSRRARATGLLHL